MLPASPPYALPPTVLPDLATLPQRFWTDVVLGVPGKIVAVVVLGVLIRLAVHRAVTRLADGIATGRAGLGQMDRRLAGATAMLGVSPLLSLRREQRARTLASLLRSITTGTVTVMVALMVMQLLALPIAPVIASAGVLGVAVGFGSQALVKDFLSGIFMIAEDQYGVGDVVDLGAASGVVEAVGLRVTQLRDIDGTVWYIRNGEVLRVGNRSQGWSRAVLDVGVAYSEDVGRVQELLLDLATGLQHDPAFAAQILEDPQVWGIESVSAEAVVVRLVVKTRPLKQWDVARELRRRIKDRFDAAGVQVAYTTGAVLVQDTSAKSSEL